MMSTSATQGGHNNNNQEEHLDCKKCWHGHDICKVSKWASKAYESK